MNLKSPLYVLETKKLTFNKLHVFQYNMVEKQLYLLIKSTQRPPLRHGPDRQSFMLTSQLSPVRPGIHSQRYPLTRSTHVPLY